MDWNNDGKKDLLTGENSGNIRLYLNTNTDANPVFKSFSYVKLGASNFDCGQYSMPWIADWNRDGLFDILCGEGYGTVYLLINTGTLGNPQFTTSQRIKLGASNLVCGTRSAPVAADWDRDGNIDLLVGETNGYITFYRNVRNNRNPTFTSGTKLYAGGQIIDVYYYSRPCVADWNEDGVMDILCGNYDTRSTSTTAGVIYYHSVRPLTADAQAISAKTGGTVTFNLYTKPIHAKRLYVILASVSGAKPGMTISPGVVLPINFDSFTSMALCLVNTPLMAKFGDRLDINGRATATFNATTPLPLACVGVKMTFAYALIDNKFDYASNFCRITIEP